MFKSIIKVTIPAIMLFGLSQIAMAEELPRALARDSRIKLINYDENNVFRVMGHDLIQTSIEFHPNEVILDVSSGDSMAWHWDKAAGRDNILFVKPILDTSDTNMKVITNKRIYEFRLVANNRHFNEEDVTYKLKFRYPAESKNLKSVSKKANIEDSSSVIGQASDPRQWNFEYNYSGNPRLAPIQVFDNQKDFTYFKFKDTSNIPAIYAVESNRKEQLVNYKIEGPFVVVEKVTGQFSLRDGQLATTVINENYIKSVKG